MTSRIKLSSALLIGVLLAAVVLAVPAVTAQFTEQGAPDPAAIMAATLSGPHEVFDSAAITAEVSTRAVQQIEYNLTRAADPVDKNPAWLKQGVGTKILFASNRDSAADAAGVEDNYDLWTMNPDGSGKVKLYASDTTDEIEPIWSPSGTRIAFARKAKAMPDSAYQIYYYDTITSALIQITYAADFPNGARHPAWRPDGAGIILQADTGLGTGTDLWMVNLDGSGVVQIEGGPGEETDPKLYNGSLIFTSDSVDSGGTAGLLDSADSTQASKQCWIARWLGYAATDTQQLSLVAASNNQEPEIVAFDTSGAYALIVFASDENGDFDIFRAVIRNTGTWNVIQGPDALLPNTSAQIPIGRKNNFDDVDPSSAPIAATPTPGFDTWANPKTAFTTERDYTGWMDPNFTPDLAEDNGVNIWVVSIDDINPPILNALPVITDPGTGLERKAFNPGSTIRITARVSDGESGVGQVWAVFHDADDAQWGTETYDNTDDDWIIPGDDKGATLMTYKERNYYVINANTGTTAGILDFNVGNVAAWGRRLYDDGAHGDGAANDGVYSNTWTTPNREIDYYVDIVPFDVVGNYITSYNFTGGINLAYGYDNITGFTTKPFVGGSRILYISDYACGQKFIGSINEGYIGAGSNRYGVVGIPVDHYLLTSPLPFYTKDPDYDNPVYAMWYEDSAIFGAGQNNDIRTWHSRVYLARGTQNLGSETVDYSTDFPLKVFYYNLSAGLYDNVDVWRVLCRGPITTDVLANFLPRMTTDPVTGLARQVNEKFVVWLSPYTGDLWTGAGTIRDLAVQGRLQTFMDQGGRMVLSGQDVAWALTLNGAAPSAFLNQLLRRHLCQ